MKNITIQSERFDSKALKSGDLGDRYLRGINSASNTYIDYTNQKRSFTDIQSYVAEREDDSTILFFGIVIINGSQLTMALDVK
tara:strand:- start:2330 stop:2578 length:249 start_codon:yes stop_codon:yes gene_type:complete